MTKKQVPLFHCTKPCNNCPYRTDTRVQMWAKEEFSDLLEKERSTLGTVYGCHKKNGSVCVGFLMNQDERGLPSIALRMALTKHNVTRDYLDRLKSPAPLYSSIEEMVMANYPELLDESVEPEFSLTDFLQRIKEGFQSELAPES